MQPGSSAYRSVRTAATWSTILSPCPLKRMARLSLGCFERDLEALADEGLLRRVHGGALPHSPGPAPYAARLRQEPTAKTAIARAAAHTLRNGQVILLDGGTTTLRVTEQLAPDLRPTVLTNSPPTAAALAAYEEIEVTLIGSAPLNALHRCCAAKAADRRGTDGAQQCMSHHAVTLARYQRRCRCRWVRCRRGCRGRLRRPPCRCRVRRRWR